MQIFEYIHQICYTKEMKERKKPFLSVITINRNNAEGLKRTVESVVSQQNVNFKTEVEYIIIDGNSTDKSVFYIEQLEKKFKNTVSSWISEPDTGIYNAMNKGIQKATGQYLHFLNSGDFYEKDALSNIILSLKTHPDLLIMAVNLLTDNVDNIEKIEIRNPPILKHSSLHHQGIIYKKDFHSQYGLYDESFKFAADYKFCLDAFYKKNIQIGYIYTPSVYFETNGVGNSENSIKEIYSIQETYFPANSNKKFKFLRKLIKNILPYGIVNLILKWLCR